MERELYRRLTNPDKKYLGKPFWSWNGDLEKDELLENMWKLVRKGWVKAFEPNDGAVRCLEESFQKQFRFV